MEVPSAARPLVLLLTITWSTGCTTSASVIEQIKPRAVFDLNCPTEKIQVVEIAGGGAGSGTYGATGCGQRVRYETQCSAAGSNCQINADTAGTTSKSER